MKPVGWGLGVGVGVGWGGGGGGGMRFAASCLQSAASYGEAKGQ